VPADARQLQRRIGKAIAVLNAAEERVIRILARLDDVHAAPATAASDSTVGRTTLAGPRLDGDTGHVSQYDIDTMFD
jgi:hypothetical protein